MSDFDPQVSLVTNTRRVLGFAYLRHCLSTCLTEVESLLSVLVNSPIKSSAAIASEDWPLKQTISDV